MSSWTQALMHSESASMLMQGGGMKKNLLVWVGGWGGSSWEAGQCCGWCAFIVGRLAIRFCYGWGIPHQFEYCRLFLLFYLMWQWVCHPFWLGECLGVPEGRGMCGNCHGGDVFVGMVTQVSHRFQYWYTVLADIKFCFQTMYKANSQYSVYPYSLDTGTNLSIVLLDYTQILRP